MTEATTGRPLTAVSPPSIEATDLSWTYAGRSRPAIEGLTFRLEAGRVLLVLGPSGSGKSTLARALAGLVPHVVPGRWQGGLRVGGLEVAETPARLLGERIGLVFQDPDSQLVMSRVDDEVAFGLENRAWPRPEMVSGVREALAQAGLSGFEQRSTVTLSGGEKQRLAIADVLAARPGLLVLDEPTANLDPPGMYAVFERLAILARRREHTIVLIEHRLEAALPLADEVLLLDDEGHQLAFAPAGAVGREAVELLERSGAWVPRQARGTQAPLRSSSSTASRPTAPAGAKASWWPSSSSSRTSSARGRAASSLCSIKTMVCSRRRARIASRSKTAYIPGGSRFAVGSSRTSNPGRAASTSAMARRCFSPPERVTVLRCSKPDRPACASASRTPDTISGRGQARFSRPNATSSSTRDMTSWLSGSWKTRPIRSPSNRAGVSATSSPPTRSPPCQRPGTTCGTRPARARARVLLPDPDGPRTSRTRPASSRNVRPSMAGRDLPA